MENCVIFDWLSVTAKREDPEYFVDLLGMNNVTWQPGKSAHGYRKALWYDSIKIFYDADREDMGIWLDMSGQGCRAFESNTTLSGKWDDVFAEICKSELRVTRLDVAYDDHTGILDMNTMIQDVRNQEYISKSSYWEIRESSEGQAFYIGSPRSEILIRVYDKARERHCDPGTHWNRVELQLRRDRARAFINGLAGRTVGDQFAGVVSNYLRFVEADSDSNRWRWPLKEYWGRFLKGSSRLSLWENPGIDYNLDRLHSYVMGQAGNAIDAYIQIKGIEQFQRDLHNRPTLHNSKYDFLVGKYGKFGEGRE